MVRCIAFLTTACLSIAVGTGKTNVYDDGGRLVQVIYPVGKATLYTYSDGDYFQSVKNVDVPVAPTSLSVERTALDTAHLVWADNANSETGYRIQRREVSGYNWKDVADVEANATSYQDIGLIAEYGYVYRIFALGEGGLTSSYTGEVAAAGGKSLAFNLMRARYDSGNVPYPIILEFESDLGARYRVERSATLAAGSWVEVKFAPAQHSGLSETEIVGTGFPLQMYLPIPEGPVFYRLLRVEAE